MMSGSVVRACFLVLIYVGSVLGATLAGYTSSVNPPAGDGDTTEQSILSPNASIQNHTAQPRTHLITIPSSLTGQETQSGFERYIAGLERLSAALRDPGHNWEASGAHVTLTTSDEVNHGNNDFRHNVQKLFAFAGTMKRLSNAMKQLRSIGDNRKMQDDSASSSEAETTLPSRLHAALTVAVANLSRLVHNYWQEFGGDEDINEEKGEAVEEDGMQMLVETLEALVTAHTNYTAAVNSTKTHINDVMQSSTPEVPATYTTTVSSARTSGRIVESLTSETPETSTQALLDWHANQRGFLEMVTQLKALLGLERVENDENASVLVAQPSTIASTSTSTTSTTTTTTSPKEPREQPCLPPFELIAYRMCILQEMQLKLSWDDAQEFCRERGAELAGDMVVIKTRRFLNDLYGEDGTRSRWPVWVGGRRAEQTWIWRGGQQVPDFLWAPNEPRKLSRHLTPEGQCMILDGYRRFYGASLPCHLRRRFVCQLSN